MEEDAAMFPAIGVKTQEALLRHNKVWQQKGDCWLQHAVPPYWGRNLIISPEIRGIYNSWLPYDEFVISLRSIGRSWLPSEEWLPLPLRSGAYLSLLDLWAAMPNALGGKLTFSEAELLPLFCALADPPRFGTVAGRYPRQLTLLRQISESRKDVRLLDVACGVGMNTLEMAMLFPDGHVTGITGEYLECWMASNRLLPHSKERQSQMNAFDNVANVCFQYGHAEAFSLASSYDVIVCNGLVGGRFFHSQLQYDGFLKSCLKSLKPGGCILLSNRFHDGFYPGVQDFVRYSEKHGFFCNGTWQDLVLTLK